ncbi:uncharacterized protein LTR77_004457 [Saxophila tyrrhenica]|uniref:Metallo-beta-lactamase domain-containing protein n=1 Tax=Saxophila tyrrhenica TaxID=1690608 RepID=A0AAV9PH11_9PEZI|nr:hypothetical protein LTR77_004457 [Saxophila tyrrhenica]
MSTFDGKVKEFPDVRIDSFRNEPNSRPPLAFFLSHVHSDHLLGLETCKSPFIYCSPGTRDILLRLEKYPHRMNFAKGILETRKQTYRHLKKLLKAIPLETPTVIELSPGSKIRVTLFDANHCVGAVMFLIEGGGKAVLYTGDIRSEKWWVDSLTRHPALIPYAASPDGGAIKTLDCIYLDTTFVVSGREDPYCHFPSKAEGIRELLQKVSQYPDDTLFYVEAWTFGYEDVWLALSKFLGCQVHVDEYRHGLYRALANGIEPKAPEAVKMIGFACGNHFQQGCLAQHWNRIHSCEKGTSCEVWSKDFVRITPIVTRHNGVEMAELGTGGGQGDLAQQHELEFLDPSSVGQLMALCATKLQGQPQLLASVLNLLAGVMKEGTYSIDLEDFKPYCETEQAGGETQTDLGDMSLDNLVSTLARLVTKAKTGTAESVRQSKAATRPVSRRRADGLPTQITFPYSRHASYNELCLLVDAFKPRDINPCTVDEKHWRPQSSMGALFGHLYNDVPTFTHDDTMFNMRLPNEPIKTEHTRPTSPSDGSEPDIALMQQANDGGGVPVLVRQPAVEPIVIPSDDSQGGDLGEEHIRHVSDRAPAENDEQQYGLENNMQPAATQVFGWSNRGRSETPTQTRNARRAEKKKLTFLKEQNLLPSQSTLKDMRQWEQSNGDWMARILPKEILAHNIDPPARNTGSRRNADGTDSVDPSRREQEQLWSHSTAKLPVHPSQTDLFWPLDNAARFFESREHRELREVPSTAPTARIHHNGNDQLPSKWPSLTAIETRSVSPLRNRWLKRMADCQASKDDEQPAAVDKKLKQDLEPGRVVHSTRPGTAQRSMERTPVSSGNARPSRHSVSLPTTMAFRLEAGDAAKGVGGLSWFDVGLVSVGGHQTREEEL